MTISIHATEGSLAGIYACFESYEGAILYMTRKAVPYKIYSEPKFKIEKIPALDWVVLNNGKSIASFDMKEEAQEYVEKLCKAASSH